MSPGKPTAEDCGVKPMTEGMAEIIVALAECGMNVSEVSRRLFYHRNTVGYRIHKIHKQTGKDPLNFYDLCELLPIAKAILQ